MIIKEISHLKCSKSADPSNLPPPSMSRQGMSVVKTFEQCKPEADVILD